MKNLHKKKVNVLGKKVPVLMLALVVVIGLGTAALLPYFGQITGSATVSQGLLVDGESWDESDSLETSWDGDSFTSLQAKTFVSAHNLTNEADFDTEVLLETECSSSASPSSCDEIETKYIEIINPSEDEPGNVSSVTPSTNEDNVANGWAHFNKLDVGVNFVEFELTQPRSFLVCFEYRTDGNTSQMIDSNNYNTDVTDGLYPYFCLDNREQSTEMNRIEKIFADEYIEVRMVFGAETDERFDWTKVYVAGNPMDNSFVVSKGQTVDFAISSEFPKMTYPGEYTVTTTVNPAE